MRGKLNNGFPNLNHLINIQLKQGLQNIIEKWKLSFFKSNMPKSIKEIAFVVSLGTLLSKFGGMARQLVIAGAFGISAAYDAYNYAYIIPGFFLVLLGGINGPLHNSMVTLLADKNKVDSRLFINSINNILSLILLIISFFIFFSSDLLINLVGPSLTP